MHHSCDNSVMTMGFSNNVMELLNSHLLVSGHTVTSGPLLSYLCSITMHRLVEHAVVDLNSIFLWKLKLQRYILYSYSPYWRPNSWTKSRQKPLEFSSLLFTVPSTAFPWDLYFFKLMQPLIVSTVHLLYTIKEKGGKPDRKPYLRTLKIVCPWIQLWDRSCVHCL